ncbi:maleylpyruvate isomerase family mycothiol-dependent enzyme [Nocardioides sp. URHA0020]|uniref:maleylpyruvate isomerase family mycothiol-dependent enzyme n=1 Tax=Nocardioides sp. URHA0020 TaxID=1380392 RepID=UPI000685FFAB|nr:maleylpyruvate isomerase family mycothiol-dependent enzyme [Nocardioides sp. URHA0020]
MPEQMSQDTVEELLHDATRRLIRTTDGLPDAAYGEPSGLPDWTRGHVLAHLVLNAEGMAGAIGGILEGEPVPMYASQEARDQDIQDLAAAGPAAIRARLLGATTDLSDAFAALPADELDTLVERVPAGRQVPAGALPGMRLSEVSIHHADLDAGYSRADWAPAYAALLLDAMTGGWEAPDPSFRAVASDLARTWAFGDGGPAVTGTAADLGWWLTGRGAGEGLSSDSGDVPQIGSW